MIIWYFAINSLLWLATTIYSVLELNYKGNQNYSSAMQNKGWVAKWWNGVTYIGYESYTLILFLGLPFLIIKTANYLIDKIGEI